MIRLAEDHDGPRIDALCAEALDLTVGGSGQLRWKDYEGNWFPFTSGGEPREDRTRSLSLSVHNRAFHPAGLQPADLGGQRGADKQRTAPRLQAHRRRAALRAPVLGPTLNGDAAFAAGPVVPSI